MNSSGIPDNVRALIIAYISSVVQLEVLLLLHGQPAREFTAGQIAAELRIDPGGAAEQLNVLCAGSLVECREGKFYHYAPTSEDLRRAVDDLERTYAERRVAVVSMIFSKPEENIRTFTDAFRLRKEKGDG